MVTVEEIRARVEEADKARIAQRADAAARVAESVRRRAELAAALAEQDAVVTGALADARALLTDDELTRYVTAMTQIRAVTAEVENGQATPEQSAQLTAAVEGSGLPVDRFNTLSQLVSQSPYLQAKAELVGARLEKGVSQ